MLDAKYTIPMHSFVDLITNSSTELYVEATSKTVESLKELITNILAMGGSKLKCDDLFTVEIDVDRFNKDYDYDSDDEDDFDETTGAKLPKKSAYEKWEEEEYHDNYRDVHLLVKCRDENNELGKKTAEVLTNLTGLFNIEASSNY